MKIVIAMDSFKGCMTSLEAGNAAKDGAKRVFPEAEILVRPMADGGEGTVEALTPGLGGVICTAKVQGPLGREVDCRYGIVEQEKLGIIEKIIPEPEVLTINNFKELTRELEYRMDEFLDRYESVDKETLTARRYERFRAM